MKIHQLVQGSTEWQSFRLTRHGASEAAAMLGLSKTTTRSELLHIKHTGTPKEFSDWVQVHVIDYGHQVEALARPLVEDIIGEDLYPVTCSNEDEGGKMSASCDGLTMLYDTAFEHKQWNEALAASVRAGVLPDEHMPQCQQIMMVTGAERVVFAVSDGTPNNLVWIEIPPSPEWFERIRAGWAQFDQDLAAYVPPKISPSIIAEATQALPAVSVQVSGTLVVAENFSVFENALRQFLDKRLIRDPQTDQDFADLDQQIKALKRAEEALDAAEAQMLAQVSNIDAAKRTKDMLHKLTRDNRLMAEKLLESEKKRRREEKIEAARKAFAGHIAKLQHEISGLRFEVVMPDFAYAIKGMKSLSSIQDKIDTALANGKIAADQKAADIRKKLDWVVAHADEYRALLADLQQLSEKPIDDFKLAISARIDAHKKAEAERLEAERERIRKEEADRLERKAIADQKPTNAEKPAAEPITTNTQYIRPLPPSSDPLLNLSKINERLAPITLTANGLESLGFTHAATDKSAKLYRESDFSRICAALMQHIKSVQFGQQAPENLSAPARIASP